MVDSVPAADLPDKNPPSSRPADRSGGRLRSGEARRRVQLCVPPCTRWRAAAYGSRGPDGGADYYLGAERAIGSRPRGPGSSGPTRPRPIRGVGFRSCGQCPDRTPMRHGRQSRLSRPASSPAQEDVAPIAMVLTAEDAARAPCDNQGAQLGEVDRRASLCARAASVRGLRHNYWPSKWHQT
jgi:hypothetical protein